MPVGVLAVTAFHQQVHTCDQHDSCVDIRCYNDDPILGDQGEIVHPVGTLIWESHDTEVTDPAERINPDYPAFDYRDPETPRLRPAARL